MDTYEVLITKPHNKHYLDRYYKFIVTCIELNVKLPKDTYFEKHHICPKAKFLFPEYKLFRKHPWNLAKLTGRQHLIAHLLLARAYGKYMWTALHRLITCYRNVFGSKISSRLYEEVQIKNSKTRSELMKGTGNHLYGVGHTVETRLKMSNSHKGKILSEEHKKNVGISKSGSKHHMFNKHHSEETKLKISQTRKLNHPRKLREVKIKIFKLQTPDGSIIEVNDLVKFCLVNGLDVSRTRKFKLTKGFILISKEVITNFV